MTRIQQHIIQKQIFELQINREERAFQFQQDLSRLFWNKAAPSVEKLFNGLAPPDRTVRIDRLEIDLGLLEEGQWETQLSGKLLKALELALQKHLLTVRDKKSEGLNQSQAFIGKLTYFLETGHLPWWASRTLSPNLESELMEVLLNPEHATLDKLKEWLAKRPTAQKRLVAQFSNKALIKLGEKLADKMGQLSSFQARVKEQFSASAPNIDLRTRKAFWEIIFKKICLDLPLTAAEKIADTTFENEKGYNNNSPSNQNPGIPDQPNPAKNAGNAKPGAPVSTEFQTLISDQIPNTKDLNRPEEFPAHQAPPSIKTDEDNPVYVSNAGLVLLHPFIPGFFENTGLTKGEGFKTKESQERAVQLLEFVVTGLEKSFEHVLPLNKILCGLPLQWPVDRQLQLTLAEKKEAVTLLQAVIGHWENLKSTSPDGLREAFLQRDGKLVQKPNGDWNLQVERKTLDILLDKLPWGRSLVKLPWMGEMLWVEWN